MFRKYRLSFIVLLGLNFFLNHSSIAVPKSDDLRSFCGVFLTSIHYFGDSVEGVSGRIYESRRILQLIQASLVEIGRPEVLEDHEKFKYWDEQLQGLVFAAMSYNETTLAELRRISDLADLYRDRNQDQNLPDELLAEVREEDLQAYQNLLRYYVEDLHVIYTSIFRAYREYEDDQWEAGKASHVSYYELLTRPEVLAQLARAMDWNTTSDIMTVGRAVEPPQVQLPPMKMLSETVLSQLSVTEYPYKSYTNINLLLNRLNVGLEGIVRVSLTNLGEGFSAPITRELSLIRKKILEARSQIIPVRDHLPSMHVAEVLYRLTRLESQLGVYELFLNYLESFHPQLRNQGLRALRQFGIGVSRAFVHGSIEQPIGDHPVGAYQSLRLMMGALSGGRVPREMPSSYMDLVHWREDVATLLEATGYNGEITRVQNNEPLYILVKKGSHITTFRKGDLLVDESEKSVRIYDPVSKKMVPPTIYVLGLETAHNDEGTFGVLSVGVTTAHNHIEVRSMKGVELTDLTHRYDLVQFYRQVVLAHNEGIRLSKEQSAGSSRPAVEARMRWGSLFQTRGRN